MTVPTKLPLIAVTMGDPAGIGPELCLQALSRPALAEACLPVVFGDAALLTRVARACHLPEPAQVVNQREDLRRLTAPAVLDLPGDGVDRVDPGQVSAVAGAAAYRYLETAITAAQAGQIDAVCTGPINKQAFHAAGSAYPGHTEMFAALTGARRTCMMLTSPVLTCSLVTTHLGYRDVPAALSIDRVAAVIELTAAAMTRLRRNAPRLAVCGLNPHAGEHGLFGGGEEEQVIQPAIDRARRAGLAVDGPLPPDTAFLEETRRRVDAYVCMYHDQGLIPLKLLAFGSAINITLGLPFVRTSVDHGTAFDIAWQGKANPNSLFEAIRLAATLTGSSDG